MGETAVHKPHIEGTATTYLDETIAGSNLCIKNNRQAQQMYEKDGLFGLFKLFVTPSLKYHIMKWTNNRLEKVSHPSLIMTEFDAWIGLQLAMSVVRLTNMRNF